MPNSFQADIGESAASDGTKDVAIHVAGHGILALAQDVRVLYLTIGDQQPVKPADGGVGWIDARVLVAWPNPWPIPQFERSKLAEKYVRIALAGSIAQQLNNSYLDGTSEESDCQYDYGVAWKAAEQLCEDEKERKVYIATARQKLNTMLKFTRFHDCLLDLAEILQKHETLYESDIQAVRDALRW